MEVSSLHAATGAEAPDPSGRIPFRIQIGVTGHRQLDGGRALTEAVRRQVCRVRELFGSPATVVRLGVISQLADGADRLVVEEVFAEAEARGEEARLEAVLPMRAEEYALAQDFSPASSAELHRWLARAAATTELELPGSFEPDELSHAYRAAGQLVIGRCDVLIALWKGTAGRRGGTAETLLEAAALGKPCIWISTERGHAVADNLEDPAGFYREVAGRAGVSAGDRRLHLPRDPLGHLEDAFDRLDHFNRPRVPRQPGFESPASTWVEASLHRASALATRNQERFKWAARLLSALATTAGIMLAISLSFGSSIHAWSWFEVACLLLVGAGIILVHKLHLHERWLSYRVLAERLRTAAHLAATGVNFRDAAALRAVYVERRSAEWVIRAFEEVWARRPVPSNLPVEDLRSELAEDWIGGQIRFHLRAARHHRRWNWILTRTISVLFAATLAFAIVHAFGLIEDYATFFSISLPAAGASLGVLLTVSQHRALAERYSRMHADLTAVQRVVLEADPETLGAASSEAARVIAEETGDWLGAMWFLDIEHPP